MIVGEAYPVILSAGSFFNDLNNPQPVVKIANTGDTGYMECESSTTIRD